MAEGDDIHRTPHTPKNQRVQNSLLHSKGCKDKTTPTFQQLLQRDGSKWSRISSQIKKKEDEQNRHSKKSVVAKVKEQAKKLKISLRWKKHGDTNESRCSTTRSSCVGLQEKMEVGVEYHSARVHDSKQTLGINKVALESTFGKNLEIINANQSEDEHTTEAQSYSSVFVDAADTKNQTAKTINVPKQHELSQRNSTIFQALMDSTQTTSASKSDRSVEDGDNMKGESQTRDKGVVTVKDYLIHKFKPGEDERALSKAITQTISPRQDKMRETLSLFLKKKESSEGNSSNVDNNVDLNIKSKSLPTSTNLNTNIGSKFTPIKQSNNLGSNASLNLNQTFKSTFASYQDRFVGSSSNHNMILNNSGTSSSTYINQGSNRSLTHVNSPTKTSSSPVGASPSANNETRAPSRGLDSAAKKSRIPGGTATSVRRVHVSRVNQKRVPIHNTETNIVNSVSCI